MRQLQLSHTDNVSRLFRIEDDFKDVEHAGDVDLARTYDVVDTHVHIWTPSAGILPWLTQDRVTFEGDYGPIAHDFSVDNLERLAENAPVRLRKFVDMEVNASDPLAEARIAQEAADQADLPVAIVAGADLRKRDVEATLEEEASYPDVRGVRQSLNTHPDAVYTFVDYEYMDDPKWRKGLALLSKYGLSFDVQLYPSQFAKAAELFEAHTDTVFIIDHAGMLLERTLHGWTEWRTGLIDMASHENVFMKISGLGILDHHWTLESIKPYVFTCLEAFGIDRCMFASNFPVDGMQASYAEVWSGFLLATEGLSETERRRLLVENAERVYRF